ncbi:MAG: hypothetical protein L6420_00120 [Elusimicrobia bacterium]|nr:hypothetical protein [Elusimicrobiota bacterium]
MNKKRIFFYIFAAIVFIAAISRKQKEVKALRNSSPVTFNALWQAGGKPIIAKKVYRKNVPKHEKITLKPSGEIFKGYVPRKISEKLKPGQNIHADFNGRQVKGEIIEVSPKISFDTGMNLVKAYFHCPGKCDKWLVSYVKVGEIKSVISVPNNILVREKDTAYVWAVKDSLAVKREVSIKSSDGYISVVNRGITPGDTIIYEGQSLLFEGDKVSQSLNGELK